MKGAVPDSSNKYMKLSWRNMVTCVSLHVTVWQQYLNAMHIFSPSTGGRRLLKTSIKDERLEKVVGKANALFSLGIRVHPLLWSNGTPSNNSCLGRRRYV